jgi:hypothetical protein
MTTLNINQFKDIIDTLPENHTMIVEGRKPYTPTITVFENNQHITYFLVTQKNALRYFKTFDALIDAIGVTKLRKLNVKFSF